MSKVQITGTAMPSAHIAVNKSRLKLYNNNSTYYLKNGTEFQIELFNPTTGNVLAKIQLNGKTITQGGLVLKPGQRVFLERYIDVAKKFLFETYEVSGNDELVKAAIKDNGDFKVDFFAEKTPQLNYNPFVLTTQPWWQVDNTIIYGSPTGGADWMNVNNCYLSQSNMTDNISNINTSLSVSSTNEPTSKPRKKCLTTLRSLSKSIETGRVEKGSESKQELTTVDLEFNTWSINSVTYKLLPISQKVNTTDEIQVKAYCTECGAKQKKGFKFCPVCGNKN